MPSALPPISALVPGEQITGKGQWGLINQKDGGYEFCALFSGISFFAFSGIPLLYAVTCAFI